MSRSSKRLEFGSGKQSDWNTRSDHVESQQVQEQTSQLHMTTRHGQSTGIIQRPHPLLSVSHAEANVEFVSPTKVFLETEATLDVNMVNFFGLWHLTHACAKFGIMSITSLSSGFVAIRGNFQAVNDVHDYLSRLMAQNRRSTAFQLAFSSSFPVAYELKIADDNPDGPYLLQLVEDVGRETTSGIKMSDAVHRELRNEEGDTSKTGSKCNVTSDKEEMHGDPAEQRLLQTFELDRVMWEVAVLTETEKLQNISKHCQVQLSTSASPDVNRLTVALQGQNQKSFDQAQALLLEVTSAIAGGLDEARVPLGPAADVSWLKQVNWATQKVVHKVEDGNICVLQGLKENVDKAKRKLKRQAHSRATKSTPSFAEVKYFKLKTGQHIVIKWGNIGSETAYVLVIVTDPRLRYGTSTIKAVGGDEVTRQCRKIEEEKGSVPEGEAVLGTPGLLSCRAVVYAVTSGRMSHERSTSNKNQVLKKVFLNSLKRAEEIKASTVAIQGLGTGLCDGSSNELCAGAVMDATEAFFTERVQTTIRELRFVDTDKDTVQAFTLEARRRYSFRTDVAGSVPSFQDTYCRQNDTDSDTFSECAACRSHHNNATLPQCGHSICQKCIVGSNTPHTFSCPICVEKHTSVQPETVAMSWTVEKTSLPGYKGDGTIVITYHMPGERQFTTSPAIMDQSTTKIAYLPDNREGRVLRRLLKEAFDRRLVFALEQTSGNDGQGRLVWNGIEHKTSVSGGPETGGYPDADYMKRLREDLNRKGID